MKRLPATAPRDRTSTLYFLAAGAVILYAAALSVFPVQSDDVMMYLALGKRMFHALALPTADPFLFSIPNHRLPIEPEWLSVALSYVLFRLGSWDALIAAKTLLVGAACALPLFIGFGMKRERGDYSALSLLLTMVALRASSGRFIERTSLVTDGFTAFLLFLLLREGRKSGKWIVVLPALFILWVNLHGGFLFGLALLALWLAAQCVEPTESFRLRAACAGSAMVSWLINPKGPFALAFPLESMFDPRMRVFKKFTYEWLPTLDPLYASSADVGCFLVLTILTGCLVAALFRGKRRPWFELAAFALLAWEGFQSIRFISLASLSLAVLGSHAALELGWLTEGAALPTAASGILALGLAARVLSHGYVAASGPPRKAGGGLDARAYPIRAAEVIERIGLAANLFNLHDFGSYLCYRWDGSRKLFFHGWMTDTDLFLGDYAAVSRSPEDFDRVVEKYKLGAFLLGRVNASATEGPLLYRLLLTRPDWTLVYQDEQSMLFLRRMPENAEALKKAREIDADAPRALNELGLTMARAGKMADAAREFERAIAAKPDFAEAHESLGLALASQGQLSKAVPELERALALDPAFPDGRRNLELARRALRAQPGGRK